MPALFLIVGLTGQKEEAAFWQEHSDGPEAQANSQEVAFQ